MCLDNDPNFILLELMEGGDLLSYMRAERPTQVGGVGGPINKRESACYVLYNVLVEHAIHNLGRSFALCCYLQIHSK